VPRLSHTWQEINVTCHLCHSWQDLEKSMITAMTFLLQILAVSAVVLLVGLVVHLVDVVRDDGYRLTMRRTPPASHHADVFDPRSRIA
jgi:hypothetical protein